MKSLLLILLIAPLLSVSCYAKSYTEQAAEELEISQMSDALPEEIREIGGELRLDGSYDGAGALERLWYRFLDSLSLSVRESMKDCLAVFSLILLCALGSALCMESKRADFVELSACAALSCLTAAGLDSILGRADTAIRDLCHYAKAALPALYSAAAVSGAPGSAAARYAVSGMGLDQMMDLSDRVVTPLLYSFFALSVSASFFDHPLLRGILQFIKKGASILLMGTCLLFSAFLSLTGIVSGSTDAAAVKAARTLISAGVPVVGRLMSDAADSVIAAAAIVKNSAGVFGLVSVAALCLSPFVSLAVKKLLFSLCSAASEMTAGARMSKLLGDISSMMGLLLAQLASIGLMLFFSIVCAIRSVSG